MLKSRPTSSASQLGSGGSEPSNSARPTATAWRTARLLIVPAALVATFSFSCGDDDESIVTPTGGSGGQTSMGGSAGLGGSGGNGGSSVAGAAGSGGSAGSSAGAGGSAGMAGSAGAAGTAGVGNDPDAGDGGVDTDSGTTPQLTAQEQAADAICVRLEDVADCPSPVAPCRDGMIEVWESYKAEGGCPDAAIVDAYFNCLATEPDANYDCSGDDTPEYSLGGQTGACSDEEGDLFACFP